MVAPAPVVAPDWVKHNGVSSKYSGALYVTGYGATSGADAVIEAKQQAAGDLARKISVRIESEVSDVSQEHGVDPTKELIKPFGLTIGKIKAADYSKVLEAIADYGT